MKKVLSLSIVIFLGLCFSYAGDIIRRVAIYGDDDRINYYEADNISKALSNSVALLVKNRDIIENGKDSVIIRTRRLSERFNLRQDIKFASEPSAGFCSGFLVSSDTLITAAHCIEEVECADFSAVFGFRIENESNYQPPIDKKNVYRCGSVVVNGRDRGYDFALIRLEKKVDNIFPLAVERNSIPQQGSSVFVIGYPSGLPVKITLPGKSRIRKIDGDILVCDIDTFRGNSGSPVFDENTLKVIGVVISGEIDYVYSAGERNVYDPRHPHIYEPGGYNIMPQDGGEGEKVLSSMIFREYIPFNKTEEFLDKYRGVLRRTYDSYNNPTISPAIYLPYDNPVMIVPAVYEIPSPKPQTIEI